MEAGAETQRETCTDVMAHPQLEAQSMSTHTVMIEHRMADKKIKYVKYVGKQGRQIVQAHCHVHISFHSVSCQAG